MWSKSTYKQVSTQRRELAMDAVQGKSTDYTGKRERPMASDDVREGSWVILLRTGSATFVLDGDPLIATQLL